MATRCKDYFETRKSGELISVTAFFQGARLLSQAIGQNVNPRQ
jgi:hypothetical protein